MIWLALLGLFSLVCLLWLAVLIYTAPEGYQDETGFHYGPVPRGHRTLDD